MQKDFARELGRAMGKRASMPAPAFVLKMVLGEKADILLASQRVILNVLKAKGFKFKFTEVDEALADLVPKI